VALDQVKLMSSLFDIQTLAKRLRSLVECSETLKLEAVALLEAGGVLASAAPKGPVSRTSRRRLWRHAFRAFIPSRERGVQKHEEFTKYL
jgi:hypothetical protein